MSSRYRPLLALSAFILLTIAAYAQPLVMQPTISPDGSSVAFSYQGDIWTVPFAGGMARRLTIHEGYETNPRWTPDGAGIAFQSDRYGNFDIFLMSATGGMPTRLTYHDVADVMISVTPQGEILFNTDRIYAQVEREDEIYKASAQGGTPARFMDALGFDAVVSPDGSKVAFVRGTCRVAREAYRGPANRDIWIWDIQEDTYTQLTRFDGNEFAPQWIDDSNLLFISPKSGKYNVHRISLDGTESQVSNESEWGINSFSYSAGNQQIVYQGGDRVKSLPLSGGTATEMNIELNTDFRFDPLTNEDKTNNVSQFAVSPDGDYIAYVHRGEIFVTRNDKKDSRSIRITNDPARDQHVTWLDDERLLFISDRNGQYDLFMAQSTDSEEANLFKSLKREVVLIKETPEEEFMPTISPDGKKIAFRRGRGQLITANISSNGQLSNEVTLQDGWATPQGMAWSPDSKWLAYGLTDLYFNQEIYIHAADGQSDPVNVSMHPKWDGNPVWSQDGSKLGFASMRNNGDMDVWFAWLREEDWERSRESLKRAELEGEEKDTTQEFSIDLENIYQRLEQVTAYAGNESELSFSKEGDYIYYAIGGSGRQDFEIERNLYKIKWDGSDKKEILGGNKRPYGLTLNAKGSHIFYLSQGGKIGSVDLKSDKTEDQTTKSVYAIDRMAERDQVFEEGWRALNAGFYDPKFHGRDWEGLKAKYKPVAMKASTTEDFQYLYNLMLGQLDASHMGLRGSDDPKETQKDDTGLLGIEGEPEANGYRVTAVLAKSPRPRPRVSCSSATLSHPSIRHRSERRRIYMSY
ncbi:MAG: peptidase S41 [Bacteroidota bacterium]